MQQMMSHVVKYSDTSLLVVWFLRVTIHEKLNEAKPNSAMSVHVALS